jgi:hypothetical protein
MSIRSHGLRHPMDMGDKKIQAFMSLVNERRTRQAGDYPNRSERLLGARTRPVVYGINQAQKPPFR